MNCWSLFVGAFTFILSIQSSYTARIRKTDLQIFPLGINRFSAEFYKSLAKNKNGNFISSPVSAAIAISMAACGANGKTRDELVRALHLPITKNLILESFRNFIFNLNNVKDIELHLATKLFIQNQFEINELFNELTNIIFQSQIENINFNNTDEAATKINNWCAEYTKNKITDIITAADDLEDSRLVMINAVYFQGNWKYPFKNVLHKKTFHLSENDSITIPMMCNTAPYNYNWINNRTAMYLELPYVSDPKNKFSMYIIIPEEINELAVIVDKIHEIDFRTFNRSIIEEVHLCMPKFKFESELDLIPTFNDMGIYDMFEDTADFSNLTPENNLKVSKIIQKAFIYVDEKGSEASVATASMISFRTIPLDININKPFISAIVSKATGTPLFLARINDPRSLI